MSDTRILLASASPRRAQLLEQIGVSFKVAAQDVDETPAAEEEAKCWIIAHRRDDPTGEVATQNPTGEAAQQNPACEVEAQQNPADDPRTLALGRLSACHPVDGGYR